MLQSLSAMVGHANDRPSSKNTSSAKSCPSASRKLYKYSHFPLWLLPRVMPATNAAMKPLPPISSAMANDSSASAMPASLANRPSIHWRSSDHVINRPPSQATVTPAAGPSVTWSAAN